MKLLIICVLSVISLHQVQSCIHMKMATFTNAATREDRAEFDSILNDQTQTVPQQTAALYEWSEKQTKSVQKELHKWLPNYMKRSEMYDNGEQLLYGVTRKLRKMSLLSQSRTLTIAEISKGIDKLQKEEMNKDEWEILKTLAPMIQRC